MENTILFECQDQTSYDSFAQNVKMVIKDLLLQKPSSVKIKGTKSQVRVFSNVCLAEKEYFQNVMNFGNDAAATQKSKIMLQKYIQEFEDLFGFPWPLD